VLTGHKSPGLKQLGKIVLPSLLHSLRIVFHPQRLNRFPHFTAWCSESISYVRVGCPILVQKAGIREHLCNYCATGISTAYPADGRPSRALAIERLTDLASES
jgi:hypothetical protein